MSLLKKNVCCFSNIKGNRLAIEITSRCIFRCYYCYRTRTQDKISLNVFKKIIDSFSDYISDLLITGGEPMLHPSIREIIEYISNKKFSVSLSTTGYKLSQIMDLLLSMENLRSINLSHDSINRTINNYIRGPKAYELFRETLNYIKTLKENSSVSVKVQITLTNVNFPTLVSTIGYLYDNKFIDKIILSSAFPLSYYIPGLEKLLSEYAEKLILVNINTNTEDNYYCLLGNLIYIKSGLTVHPCPFLPEIDKIKEDITEKLALEIINEIKRRYGEEIKDVKNCPAQGLILREGYDVFLMGR